MRTITTLISIFFLFAFQLTKAQDVEIVPRGALSDVEGNFAEKIGTTETFSNVNSIKFSSNAVNVSFKDKDDKTFKASTIDKISLSGKVNKLPLFYPSSIDSLLNYETSPSDTFLLPEAPAQPVVNSADPSYPDFQENFIWKNKIYISYSGSSVNIVGDTAKITFTSDGAHLSALSSRDSVEYILSGTSTNGSFQLTTDKPSKLLLSGLTLTDENGPVITSTNAGRTYIVTKDSTVNSLSDRANYSSTTFNSVISASGRLLLSGQGNLNIAANHLNGITSSNFVRILGGLVQISVMAEGGNAIYTTDSTILSGGTVRILALGNAAKGIYSTKQIHTTGGQTDIITKGDGEQADDQLADKAAEALFANDIITVDGGTLRIKTVGGIGAVGLACMKQIVINAGTIIASCYDDAFNAVNGISVNGGEIFLTSAVDDGIDTNGSLSIKGGTLFVISPARAESPFDNDGKTFAITGGTIIGMGLKTDKPQTSVTKQPTLCLTGINSDSYIRIQKSTGEEILSFATPSYPSMTVLISSPKLLLNTAYEVYTARTQKAGTEHFGVLSNPDFANYTLIASFSMSSNVTTVSCNN